MALSVPDCPVYSRKRCFLREFCFCDAASQFRQAGNSKTSQYQKEVKQIWYQDIYRLKRDTTTLC